MLAAPASGLIGLGLARLTDGMLPDVVGDAGPYPSRSGGVMAAWGGRAIALPRFKQPVNITFEEHDRRPLKGA